MDGERWSGEEEGKGRELKWGLGSLWKDFYLQVRKIGLDLCVVK